MPLKVFDPEKIILTDTNYNKVAAAITIDSNLEKIYKSNKMIEDKLPLAGYK